MEEYDDKTNNIENRKVLEQKTNYYNLSCLDMADAITSRKFIALNAVQNYITTIWNGEILDLRGIMNKFKV